MDPAVLGDVKSALAAFPGLADVAVVEHAHARKALPNGSMPAAIVVVDEIPATAAGAVVLSALPVPDLGGLLPYRAPATARQEALCELFAEVLGVARCGVDNDRRLDALAAR